MSLSVVMPAELAVAAELTVVPVSLQCSLLHFHCRQMRLTTLCIVLTLHTCLTCLCLLYVCVYSSSCTLLYCMCSVMDRLPASGKLRVVGSTARAVFQCLQNLRQRQKGMVSRSDDLERSADSCEEDEEGVAKLCTTTDLEYVVGMLGFWRAASGVFLHAWLETEGRVDNELLPLQSACISG